jgi:hypothetical protein
VTRGWEYSLPGTFPAAVVSALGPRSGEGQGKELSLLCVWFPEEEFDRALVAIANFVDLK